MNPTMAACAPRRLLALSRHRLDCSPFPERSRLARLVLSRRFRGRHQRYAPLRARGPLRARVARCRREATRRGANAPDATTRGGKRSADRVVEFGASPAWSHTPPLRGSHLERRRRSQCKAQAHERVRARRRRRTGPTRSPSLQGSRRPGPHADARGLQPSGAAA